MAKQAIQVGDTVRLTGKFLRNTGQHTGSEGLSRWIVTGVDTAHDWVITNEPTDTFYFTAEELAADHTLAFRRIALANLEKVKGQ